MPRRVLIVPDKFKGTLSADAAAKAIARGWSDIRTADRLELQPMSDGGDGFGETLSRILQVIPRRTETVDAARRPRGATWWWNAQTRTALIESAQVVGLALLPEKVFHPFKLDTFGLGSVLKEADKLGAERCLVGIGGSATNDGGFGLACALGWRFVDDQDKELVRWTELVDLKRIVPPTKPLSIPELIVAVDVQNPLLGPYGASQIYGPQKGLRSKDFALAEACLSRLADVATKQFGSSFQSEPGSGAAGGLGFGLRTFCKARLESGFNLFSRYAKLEERIRASDLVLTGEGAIDQSSLMGKGVGEIARLCLRNHVPCLGLAGQVSNELDGIGKMPLFLGLYGIVPELASAAKAQREAASYLALLARRAAERWSSRDN